MLFIFIQQKQRKIEIPKDINLTNEEIEVLDKAFKKTMKQYRKVFEWLAKT